MTKKVLSIHEPGSEHWVGDGFPVRNLFPSNGVPASTVDPFLMLDYAGPHEFPPLPEGSEPRGVGEHPHRGFETVTIVYQGWVAHRDSAGNSGVIGPGDVQWMTAASGVVHEEFHETEFARRGGKLEMVQLWVNLPAEHKMTAPRYQGIASAGIPAIEISLGAVARVIAGSIGGGTAPGPARTFTPITVIDLRLAAGSHAEVPLPEGCPAAAVLLNGAVGLSDTDARMTGEAQIALLARDGDSVRFAARADSTVLLLSGAPLGEPVASYGPFVMNTQAEIRQAIEDYRQGRMGRL